MEKLHMPTTTKKRARAAIIGGFLMLSGAGCSAASEEGITTCRLGEGQIEIDAGTDFEEDLQTGEFKNPSNIIIYLTANENKMSKELRSELNENSFWSIRENIKEAEDLSCRNEDETLGLNHAGEKLQAEAQRLNEN